MFLQLQFILGWILGVRLELIPQFDAVFIICVRGQLNRPLLATTIFSSYYYFD
jgi:hypothetical protein